MLFTGLLVTALRNFGQSATLWLKEKDAKTWINKNIYGYFAEHLGRCIYDHSSRIQDHNSFDDPEKIKLEAFSGA